MRTEEVVRILRSHIVPRPSDDSRDGFSYYSIRYLKNVGYLDCYYDYKNDRDMTFTTEAGRRYVELHEGNAALDDLRDIVYVEKDHSSDRYIEAVKRVVGARID